MSSSPLEQQPHVQRRDGVGLAGAGAGLDRASRPASGSRERIERLHGCPPVREERAEHLHGEPRPDADGRPGRAQVAAIARRRQQRGRAASSEIAEAGSLAVPRTAVSAAFDARAAPADPFVLARPFGVGARGAARRAAAGALAAPDTARAALRDGAADPRPARKRTTASPPSVAARPTSADWRRDRAWQLQHEVVDPQARALAPADLRELRAHQAAGRTSPQQAGQAHAVDRQGRPRTGSAAAGPRARAAAAMARGVVQLRVDGRPAPGVPERQQCRRRAALGAGLRHVAAAEDARQQPSPTSQQLEVDRARSARGRRAARRRAEGQPQALAQEVARRVVEEVDQRRRGRRLVDRRRGQRRGDERRRRLRAAPSSARAPATASARS